jgi:hypothetical protein
VHRLFKTNSVDLHTTGIGAGEITFGFSGRKMKPSLSKKRPGIGRLARVASIAMALRIVPLEILYCVATDPEPACCGLRMYLFLIPRRSLLRRRLSLTPSTTLLHFTPRVTIGALAIRKSKHPHKKKDITSLSTDNPAFFISEKTLT